MRLSIVGLMLLVAHTEIAHAQIRTFPYTAVVQAEPAYARSGPGRSYYPTSKLNVGEQVTVHRHDPGGWYMIAPPEGSFSWIRAEYVDKTAGNRGVLTANNVVVRVGSAIDDVYDVEQRRLSTGDEIDILGEQTFRTDRGAIKMYKIAPPQGEYRWVLGKAVVPVDETLREQRNRDPFVSPIPTPELEPHAPVAHPSRPAARSHGAQAKTDAGNPVSSGPSRADTDDPFAAGKSPGGSPSEGRSTLAELDAQLRSLPSRQPEQWDLAGLEHAYQQLHRASRLSDSQMESRLSALEHYKQIRKEYEAFIHLTSETSKREAQLLALQREQQEKLRQIDELPGRPQRPGSSVTAPTPVGRTPSTPTPTSPASSSPAPAHPAVGGSPGLQRHYVGTASPVHPQMLSTSPTGTWRQVPGRQPVSVHPPQPVQQPMPTHHRSGPSQPVPGPQQSQPPRFDGAGIVDRAATTYPGAPRHVLLAPDGRILAYLVSESGVNLDRLSGQAMGIVGRRFFHPDLQADVIQVRGATPVRLQP
jgi:hypothetical protein